MSTPIAIPLYQGSDVALSRFAAAVKSNLDALQGRGGDKTDQAVTVATLAPIQKVVDQLNTPKRSPTGLDYTIDLGGNLSATINVEELAAKLMGTSAFKNISTGTTTTTKSTTETSTAPASADRLIYAAIDRINATLANLQTEIDDLNKLTSASGQTPMPADLLGVIRSAKVSADAIAPSKAGNQDGIGHNRSIHDVVSRFTQFDGASAPNNNSDDRIPGLYINRTVRVKANDWDYRQTYSFGQLTDAVLKLWLSATGPDFLGISSNYTGTDTGQKIDALKKDALGHDWSIHDTIIGKTTYKYETTSNGEPNDPPTYQYSTVPEIATAATLGADLGQRAKDKLIAHQTFLDNLHGFDLYINGVAADFGVRIDALEDYVRRHS